MADYNSLLKGFEATTEPLDTQGDYKQLLEGFTPASAPAPMVSQETTEEVTKKPVGRPEGAPEAPTGAPEEGVESMAPEVQESQRLAAEAADKLQLNPYISGQSYGTAIENIQAQAQEAGAAMSVEGKAAAQEFIREEALPVVGGVVGTILAPTTGGGSLLMAMGITAGSAGVGAAVGEGIEQTAKLEGLMDVAATETAPKDAWDVFERSVSRGAEEAAWTLVPDMFFRGVPQGVRKLLTKGAKPAQTVAGETIDLGRQALIETMEKHAAKSGTDAGDLLLTSDIVESGLFNAAENVASNSYISGRIPKVRGAQEEALKEEIVEQVGQFMEPAKGYVQSTSDAAIQRFIEPNMESMNDFAIAGLVNVGFKKAQDAQKAVARASYKAIGGLMERSKMVSVYKEVELPFLGPDGNPMSTMQTVLQEQPAFPVDLTKVREIGEERMDVLARTGAKPDRQTSDLLNMSYQTDYEAAAERLIDMKADSRSLGKSMTEGSAKQKMVLDKAIAEMEIAMESAMKQADEAGIVTADGRSLYEIKKEADAIWKEQVEDFQNSYVLNIIKKTNPKNGAPEKLGRLFMQNETASRNIMKVLDDAKGTLKGDELEQIVQAENAIKGSIVEEIFMPFDGSTGKYLAPDVSVLRTKEKELTRIFGKESFEELQKLGAAIEQQAGGATSNYLGFAQRARESGMVMTTLKGLSQANFGPLLRDGGSTVMFALGAGKLLTSPKMIRQVRMLSDPKVDPAVKTQIAQWLVHRTYEWQQAQEASLTDMERQRMEGKMETNKEADDMRKGM